MTPNEEELLERLKGISEASITTIGKQIGLSIDYTKQLCKGLVNKGMLKEVISGGQLVYRLNNKEKVEEQVTSKQIHPLWIELMRYVQENGGHLRMNVRFKDGVPVEAEDIKKKVRFDMNFRMGKGPQIVL